MKNIVGLITTVFLLLSLCEARCPNDCSGHGDCTGTSVCECHANFIGSDCSSRLCLHSRAVVDTPMGDINGNDQHDVDLQIQKDMTNGPILELFPGYYGFARQNNTQEWDEAHFYQECSNRGRCNRKTGVCKCYPGFEGAGCQRITCNNKCSGHGQCVLISDVVPDYRGWDADFTQMCLCDGGYFGPDCSQRRCPQGADPHVSQFYNSDSIYKIEFPQKEGIFNGDTIPNGELEFSLTYTDEDGRPWTTSASTIYYQAKIKGTSTSDFDPQVNFGDNVISNAFYRKTNDGENMIDIQNRQNLAEMYSSNLYEGTNFVAEQVNNSLHNLPNDLIRNSYVWVVRNEVTDSDSSFGDISFLYPSYNLPDFSIGKFPEYIPGDTANGGKVGYPQCNTQTAGCAGHKFDSGPSIFVNDKEHRFPFWFNRSEYNKIKSSSQQVAVKFFNCASKAMCIFVKIPQAKGTKTLTGTYRFRARTVFSVGSPVGSKFPLANATFHSSNEVTGVSNDKRNIMNITEEGGKRIYFEDVDGSPTYTYTSSVKIHECSKRGVCNYDDGTCACFEGFGDSNCGKIKTNG